MAVTSEQEVVLAGQPKRSEVEVKAGVKLLAGTHCFIDNTDGFAKDTFAASDRYGGVVVETVDNTSGADGDLKAEVYRDVEMRVEGSFVQTDLRQDAHATDNFTFANSGGAVAGKFSRIESATVAYVAIDN